jgi:hypothetical protein
MVDSEYSKGQQPCATFKRHEMEYEDGGPIAHVCYRCRRIKARRVFCATCNRDHHSGGWDTCHPSDTWEEEPQ